MSKIRRIIVGILVLFLAVAWQQLPEKLPTVVKIETQSKDGDSWSGSGVFIEDDLILTAGHIVNDAENIWVVWKNKKHKVIKWYQETEADLGVIIINTPEQEPTATLYNPKLKQRVWVCGAPYGIFPIWTEGIISAINMTDDYGHYKKMIITDAATAPGNSGCPLLDRKNRILGICSWGYNGQGMSYYTRAEICKLVLEKYRISETLRKVE